MKQAIGTEIHVLAKLMHRALDNSPGMKAIESVTGTNGWIIGFIAKKNADGENVYQKDLEKHFGITRSTGESDGTEGSDHPGECTGRCPPEEAGTDGTFA